MTDSILDSVKEALGVPTSADDFNGELVLHVNANLATLRQLGVGPVGGFAITGKDETWDQFLGTDHQRFNDVKQFLYLRVKIVFDPPQVQAVMDAFKDLIAEAVVRINDTREETDWVDPDPTPIDYLYTDPVI